MKGLVNKIIPFSSVDGPGNRTAIFLQGCNFNCLYCHNPETINSCNSCGRCVESCPYGALSILDGRIIYEHKLCKNCDTCLRTCEISSSPKTRSMEAAEVMVEISKYKPFISGITVSGGECMLQSQFLVELFHEAKREGLSCFVDSNGSLPFSSDLLEVMDAAMIDLKAYDADEHQKLTGCSNEEVIRNIELLANLGKLYEVRTVIVPEVLDNEHTVEMTARLIARLDKDIRYKLIKYRAIGVRAGYVDSYTPEEDYMNSLKALAEKNGCVNIVIV